MSYWNPRTKADKVEDWCNFTFTNCLLFFVSLSSPTQSSSGSKAPDPMFATILILVGACCLAYLVSDTSSRRTNVPLRRL